MKMSWHYRANHLLTPEETRRWLLTSRLAGLALGVAILLAWTLAQRYWF
jgi:hypothetical protein